MTLLYDRHAGKNRQELMDEVTRLEKELRTKNQEISVLKKRLSLYKTV